MREAGRHTAIFCKQKKRKINMKKEVPGKHGTPIPWQYPSHVYTCSFELIGSIVDIPPERELVKIIEEALESKRLLASKCSVKRVSTGSS